MHDYIEAIKDVEALTREAAGLKILGFVARIISNVGVMRDRIDTANKRISDIDNFKLSDFMLQGIDQWTADVQKATRECEDNLIADCKDLAKSFLDGPRF